MKNKIEDLRNHLFETIEGLKDRDNPMELERAKAISDVAQTIINSAKLEVDLLRVTGGVALRSGFLPSAVEERPDKPRLVAGVERA